MSLAPQLTFFVKHTTAAFHRTLVCCGYHLWLFLLTRCSLGTVFIRMKPEIRCTSVSSLVSLLIGVEKKTWPIVTFAIESIDDLHGLSRLLRSALEGLPNKTLHITRRGPTLTTDQIQSLLLKAYGCNKAQVQP